MVLVENSFSSLEASAAAMASMLAETLRGTLAERGSATLAVSGGRTPRHVFQHLRDEKLDWARVIVTLTDERWVPPSRPESNERLIRTHLLQAGARLASFVPMFGGEATPVLGHEACEGRLRRLEPPLDAVYLGLGEDGHFASLFPHDAALVARGLTAPVAGDGPRSARMTLTAEAILQARAVYLLFNGEGKLAAYRDAREPGSQRANPLRILLGCERCELKVFMSP